MQIKKEGNKISILIIIGFLIILFGLYLIIFHFVSNKKLSDLESDAINDFYIKDKKIKENSELKTISQERKDENKIEYIAILKIPKINLERGLVNPNSHLNNVSYNVQILKNSVMPDKENGNVILAAHSGNSRVSYFKNLDKLLVGDRVIIDYKGKTYNYKVTNIYDIEKTGTANIVRNKNVSTLTLITCRHNTNRQIIIISELEK